MKTKIITLVLALLLTGSAFAEFTLITKGAEVALSDVRLPRNNGGTISFKPCDDCDYETRMVSPDASWQINHRVVTLAEFKRRVAHLSDHDERAVTVTRHIKQNRITKVNLTIRESE